MSRAVSVLLGAQKGRIGYSDTLSIWFEFSPCPMPSAHARPQCSDEEDVVRDLLNLLGEGGHAVETAFQQHEVSLASTEKDRKDIDCSKEVCLWGGGGWAGQD